MIVWLVSLLIAFVASPLQYEAPSEWESRGSRPMRLAQWELASATGDSETAEVVIFYFGEGQGGGVEANLERWYGQFEQPDGSRTRDKALVKKMSVGKLELTRADMSGTYVAPMRPGAPQKRNNPAYRMIATVVEGPGGPWFIRLLGPQATVARWETSYDTFLQSLKVE